MSETPKRLLGFDNRGQVYDAGDRIVRTVNAADFERALDLFERYERHRLDALGVVQTQLHRDTALSLSHRKLVISYPFEWTPNMFKDAALFHLDLLDALAGHGLTFKDFLPSNILFDGAKPQFVDFFSIVPVDALGDEDWLGADKPSREPWTLVMTGMFFPYFAIPLFAMARPGGHAHARRLLAERACNCTKRPPSLRDLLAASEKPWSGFGPVLRYVALTRALGGQQSDFVARARREIASLDMAPPSAGYDDYYATKSEDFLIGDSAAWKAKQRSVHEVLATLRPATVLDVGTNTGWFARLAASLGAKVIATDVDESSIDRLYLIARNESLPILPLKLAFTELTRELRCLTAPPDAPPLAVPATKRFQSDAVLCLGLLHHLVLGENLALESILEVLATLTRRSLVLEFVALDDDMIRENPTFFPALRGFNAENYNLDRLRQLAAAHFGDIRLMDSHPGTRTLLVLEKR